MQNIASTARYDFRSDYSLLSCESEELANLGVDETSACDYIEKQIGNSPIIYATNDKYCVYVKITEENYFCIDAESTRNVFDSVIETNINPSISCNQISYSCP